MLGEPWPCPGRVLAVRGFAASAPRAGRGGWRRVLAPRGASVRQTGGRPLRAPSRPSRQLGDERGSAVQRSERGANSASCPPRPGSGGPVAASSGRRQNLTEIIRLRRPASSTSRVVLGPSDTWKPWPDSARPCQTAPDPARPQPPRVQSLFSINARATAQRGARGAEQKGVFVMARSTPTTFDVGWPTALPTAQPLRPAMPHLKPRGAVGVSPSANRGAGAMAGARLATQGRFPVLPRRAVAVHPRLDFFST